MLADLIGLRELYQLAIGFLLLASIALPLMVWWSELRRLGRLQSGMGAT